MRWSWMAPGRTSRIFFTGQDTDTSRTGISPFFPFDAPVAPAYHSVTVTGQTQFRQSLEGAS
ncbi:hypothetical protein Rmet_6710 (plasmid) [Cupriavidus metallidurans CH34]|uniref:Uncharacterized protein n=1 Tax=Cupriavidus metallidurans (strain ATCC 43123 / DSM 2839 / NBRC 102507 / CH34) TaxID=266264 RepID=D3DYC0_CUPMC|nr:hypothetical protein Rmet_6710 [Cupriavidus metallidurans CH34]